MSDGVTEPSVPATPPACPYVSIDTETTGLDPDYCQVLEMAAVFDDWKRPISQLQTFHAILKYDRLQGEPHALAMNCALLRMIEGGQTTDPEDLGEDFHYWLKDVDVDPFDVQAAGKNFGTFDMPFLYRVPEFKERVHFRHRVIDPSAFFWLPEDTALPGSKTCYERASMDNVVAHTALEDALAIVRLIRRGVKNLKTWE
jgi:oligoribonuclease (3'-5' exoribonuclease)